MSNSPTRLPTSHRLKRARKPRPEPVTFEDLVAETRHKYAPGEIPKEGVAMIGVDPELQRAAQALASRLGMLSSPPANEGVPNGGAPNGGICIEDAPHKGTQSIGTGNDEVPGREVRTSAVSTADGNKGAPYNRATNEETIKWGAVSEGTHSEGLLNKGNTNEGTPRLEEDIEGIEESNKERVLWGARNKGAPREGVPCEGAPYGDAPTWRALEKDALFEGLDIAAYVVRAERKPVPWEQAQDAHTLGQQAVYAAMWREGKPVRPGIRLLVIGIRTLAKKVPMRYRHCLDNVRDLVAKLAIEDGGPALSVNDGHKYLIYSYDQMNQRRAAAGLTHVLRRTRGVKLVRPDGSELNKGALNTGAPLLNKGDSNQGASSLHEGAPPKGNGGTPLKGIHIRNKELYTGTRHTTSSKEAVRAGVSKHFDTLFDDDAVAEIITQTTKIVPDITDEELQHVTAHAAGTARNLLRENKLKGTWSGFIIKRTPVIATQAVAKFRQDRADLETLMKQLETEEGK